MTDGEAEALLSDLLREFAGALSVEDEPRESLIEPPPEEGRPDA
jgi:hypothetical protein